MDDESKQHLIKLANESVIRLSCGDIENHIQIS